MNIYVDSQCDKQAIDFLDKLLRYDHQDRLTAKEAMVVLWLLLFYISYVSLFLFFLFCSEWQFGSGFLCHAITVLFLVRVLIFNWFQHKVQ